MRLLDEKLLRIRILSHTGDKIHIKLPVGFVKKMIKNNTFDFFYGADDIIDSQKLLDVLIKAFDYDLSGEIAHMERKNGDIIKMIID
ncbi:MULTISPECIES: hypothetical protein [Romboutsia]|jgi:hypothetical protein|uniref:Uncharacterized protein n=1 Tax=Romboutsia ilealis TaxID=1115758 RepID=A0A1V1I218_9FIRM|nr:MULTISPECIES: hypothetical protein [Romboutsia]MCI9061970.1 hypothetical protein [Romboutsia sp.]MCI9259547.1 hypothetical protein [Romboutsia sp.]CED94292.1 Hypothetical protein CRIB_1685 [Romboutsia ilealis]